MGASREVLLLGLDYFKTRLVRITCTSASEKPVKRQITNDMRIWTSYYSHPTNLARQQWHEPQRLRGLPCQCGNVLHAFRRLRIFA